MRVVGKILKWLLGLIVVAVVGVAIWLWTAPPALIRIAANYTAKIVCSNVFLAGGMPSRCWRWMCRLRAIRSSS